MVGDGRSPIINAANAPTPPTVNPHAQSSGGSGASSVNPQVASTPEMGPAGAMGQAPAHIGRSGSDSPSVMYGTPPAPPMHMGMVPPPMPFNGMHAAGYMGPSVPPQGYPSQSMPMPMGMAEDSKAVENVDYGEDETAAGAADSIVDPELVELQRKMMEMEKEAQRLRELEENLTKEPKENGEDSDDADARSIYVGNVDYATTPEELQEQFKGSGSINRVTILCDKFTGHPKGYAYVEFATTDAVTKAQLLDGSMLHGRPLKVNPKRTNVPGVNRGRGRGRGRGFYGYPPRGRGFRGRGRGYYSPY
ncbi:hypothetical protein IWW51_001378 [Coemansia sp. RSA 2702]|nr:hypothetical protein IWW51_001378 [Coemansia sp. RSA 2702]